MADGETGGGGGGGQGAGLIEFEGPGGGEVMDGHQGEEDGGGQQPAVAGRGGAGPAGQGDDDVARGGGPALAVVRHLVGPGERDVELLRQLVAGRAGAVGIGHVGQAALSFCQVVPRSSGITRTSARAVMKLVSPPHRGTAWRWRCPGTPAPASRPRLAPTLKPSGWLTSRRACVAR